MLRFKEWFNRIDSKLQAQRFSLATVILILITASATFFVLGTRSDEIAAYLRGVRGLSAERNLDFASVQTLYERLRTRYDGELDASKLIEGAKKGLVNAVGDPYTTYFTDDEAKQYLEDLEGEFSGIGAELDKRDGSLTVLNVLEDSPALKSGLQRGDVIVQVNDEDSTNWSIDKAVGKIRGAEGTTVKLQVLRGQELKDISIVRGHIVAPSVKYEIKDNIGYMRITRFAEGDTSRLARRAADEFKERGVKGVILDLRGNGGGYLTSAQDIASLWLKDKTIVQQKTGARVVDTLFSNGDAKLNGLPTIVLIDGSSASASEIVAGALHDHAAAKLVGEKTYGKGSVQEIDRLPGGGQLKVTVARWFTPNGKNISKEGIEPDVKVELSDDDLKADRDPQKDRAYELLK